MTIEEATNVTIEDAIKTFEHVLFPQDFSPSTLRAKAINKLVLSALRAQQHSNDPLTQEELRKMDGEPVWCVDGIGNVAWCLVSVWSNREEKAQGADCVDKNDGLWDATYYGMKGNGEHGLHAVGWLGLQAETGGAGWVSVKTAKNTKIARGADLLGRAVRIGRRR